jgi:hypothetical protein
MTDKMNATQVVSLPVTLKLSAKSNIKYRVKVPVNVALCRFYIFECLINTYKFFNNICSLEFWVRNPE